jgi:hypothetical protein
LGASRSVGLRSELSPAAGTAVVVAADSVGALAAIRSLGRAGVRVIAVHQAGKALGFRSRYAERWICPDPRVDVQGFVDLIGRARGAFGRAGVDLPDRGSPPRNVDRLGDRFLAFVSTGVPVSEALGRPSPKLPTRTPSLHVTIHGHSLIRSASRKVSVEGSYAVDND